METDLLVAAGIGAACGLVPLVYGLRKQQLLLATLGFVASIAGGLLLGLLGAGTVAAIFALLITRSVRMTEAAARRRTPSA